MTSTTTKLFLGSTLIVDLTAFAPSTDLTAHTNNNTVHITNTERSTWNAKLDSSALAPYATQSWTTSQLETCVKTADLTAGYYTKTQTDAALTASLSTYATQNWVTQQIAAKHHIQILPVDTLPAAGQPDVIYLVPPSGSDSSNLREQYIWIDGQWIKVGDTGLSLSGYATETWVSEQLSPYAQTSQVASSVTTAKTEAIAESKTYADSAFARVATLTQTEYNALTVKHPQTLYIIE